MRIGDIFGRDLQWPYPGLTMKAGARQTQMQKAVWRIKKEESQNLQVVNDLIGGSSYRRE